MANVGVYVSLNRPAVVPDVFVTTHVEPLQDLMQNKEHHAYLSWLFDGRVPTVVIEIVTNKNGSELDAKMRSYQHMRVAWYAVFDPAHYISEKMLTVFAMERAKYREQEQPIFDEIGLGIMLWEGEFEGVTSTWLRWCDRDGTMLLSGKEHATAEAKRAAAEAKRAAVLAAKLRELGVDPEKLG